MSLKYKNADGDTQYLATGAGDGSSGTPFQSPLALAVGEVQANPTSNTLLDRLKTLHTDLAAVLSALGGTLTVGSHPVTNAGTFAVQADLTRIGGSNTPTGHGTAAGVMRVELPTDGTGVVNVKNLGAGSYETVAASQTDQAMGATGATGDYLAGVLIVPASTSPGAVSIKDGGGSALTVFAGGASSVSNLVPFFVPLGIVSTSGAWKVTTGTSVSAIGVGAFT